jgi:NAD+ synthase (glutamine-hydrolysing)
MRLTIAQLNPVVGDIRGNIEKIRAVLDSFVTPQPDLSVPPERYPFRTATVMERTGTAPPDLLVLPELYLTGYPPRDLLERQWFIERAWSGVMELAHISRKHPDTGILVGAPVKSRGKAGVGLNNSALLIHNGEVVFRQDKTLLPTYDVFDEARYFDPATEIDIFRFKGETLGISICEDAWNDPDLWPTRTYSIDPMEVLARKGATLFVNISASPFYVGKDLIRFRLVSNHARKHGLPFAFVNQVGANDELIFDGRSFFVDSEGKPVEICPSFDENVVTVDTSSRGSNIQYEPQDEIESIHGALVLGISDYVRKCGFRKAAISLSGGIDSAVTCVLAVDAIGADNVLGVTMPSPFSSKASVELSRILAANLGIEFKEISISEIYKTYIDSLRDHLKRDDEIDVTLENVQARIRGNILMALSNEWGHLILSTGNKSEIAVGYCTLYGDMSGGLAVLSDIPKTMVYKLAGYINRDREIIPTETITRAPSAELRPNQTDQDTLPPYDILDEILRLYVDEGDSLEEIVRQGFRRETVEWVVAKVNRNEYKRRQAAPGLKVTSKAFGMGRRMPIAAKYDS